MTDQTTTPEVPQTSATKPMGQIYYEEVEALKASGVKNADAVQQVALRHDKPVGSVRGGIYQHKMRLDSSTTGSGNRTRRQTGTIDDCLTQARASLEAALQMIDAEVESARISFESAKAHYEEAQASVKDRKSDIEKKLKALA